MNTTAFDLTRYLPIPGWRNILGIVLSWLAIGCAISLSEWHFYFYPLSALVIANRQFALTLLGHEALHKTLLRSAFWNDFAGRYFCHFPLFMSFARYRRKHMLHHGLVGTSADPDLGLYDFYPDEKIAARILRNFLTLKLFYQFFEYYSDIPGFIAGRLPRSDGSAFSQNDFGRYMVFQIASIGTLVFCGLGKGLLLYWILPLLVALPYIFVVGGIQHGPLRKNDESKQRSRTVTGPKWIMEMCLPVDINFHGEHHLFPAVPHAHLRRLSRDLEGRGEQLWRESYFTALKRLSHDR
jgi:fatty acid desaturase